MPPEIFIGIAFVAAALVVAGYHVFGVTPRMRKLVELIEGSAVPGKSPDALAAIRSPYAQRTEARLAELERLAREEVLRAGFVRYNSFADVGSDLSFTLALLNKNGDGVVITNIYSREETRTYAQSVRGFVAERGASEEEKTAIDRSRKTASVGA